MAKYMFQVSYTQAGFQGILKEGGTERKEAVETTIKSLNGWLEAFYFSFGEADMIIIAELPDNVSAAAFSLIASSAGSSMTKTTILITPAEIDIAANKTVHYQVSAVR